MDTPELTVERKAAGQRFDESLQRLGLNAQVVSWVYSTASSQFVLYVVTDFFDFKGPLEVSRLFFKAYNASAIPHEIDPFNVEFHSLKHVDGNAVATLSSARGPALPDRATVTGKFDDMIWNLDWMISRRLFEDRSSTELSRKWRFFEAAVTKLAA